MQKGPLRMNHQGHERLEGPVPVLSGYGHVGADLLS